MCTNNGQVLSDESPRAMGGNRAGYKSRHHSMVLSFLFFSEIDTIPASSMKESLCFPALDERPISVVVQNKVKRGTNSAAQQRALQLECSKKMDFVVVSWLGALF